MSNNNTKKIFKIESVYKQFQKYSENMLINKGMKQHTNEKFIDFYYIDGEYAYKRHLKKIFKRYKINTLSLINKETKKNIINKGLLYKSFENKFPNQYNKYFPKQYQLDNINEARIYKKLFDGSLWILKPIYGFSGLHIKITDNYEEYLEHIKKSNMWVISEYIKNPLLTKSGKKFHIRVYFIISLLNNEINGYITKKMPILTAKKKFRLDDYNLDIHNTHYADSDKDLFMHDYFGSTFGADKETYIYQQMIKLFNYILKMVNNELECYSKNCFEIFGADIIITDDYRIKLLEINDKVLHDPLKLNEKDNAIEFTNILHDIFTNKLCNKQCNNIFHINKLMEES